MSRLTWSRAVPVVTIGLAFSALAYPQTPAGTGFRLNAYTTSHQTNARVAMEPDGDFVVVWNSAGQDGSSDGVFATQFQADGAPRGAEFLVNGYTTGRQGDPEVAVGRKGDFVVVWTSGQDGSAASVQGRRYDALGAPVTAEFLVNTFTTGIQYLPVVGLAANGSFVVSWTSDGVDGSLEGISARRFTAAGNPIGAEFVVNTYTTGIQRVVALAVESDGDFVAVWEDYAGNRDGSGSGIFGQRYSAAGTRLGGEFLVNTYTTGDQGRPSVSASPAGGFAVVWNSADGNLNGIRSRRFDPSGSPLGADFVVNAVTTGVQATSLGQALGHDAAGNFVAQWTGPVAATDTVFAQRLDAAGARRGSEFRVNPNATGLGAFLFPSLASDSVGNFIVTWQVLDQDGNGYGVYGQRFGGLGPAALVVDSAGNRVLEPGETVDARPAWRNFNGVAQAFGGVLTGLTGPAGASHAIVDGAADYGTVANGVVAPCADCYVVSVSNPPLRPVVHWDATAMEVIVPDPLGQHKPWALHVGGSFIDVPSGSPFYRFVETLLHHSVTAGCSTDQYCPASSTRRDQMAVFVLAAREGAGYVPVSCGTPLFADVPAASPFCPWVEELVRRGVAAGCGGGNYCPAAPISRDQMAVFVLRTLDPALVPPACSTPIYGDVPATSAFCRWVEELTRRNVVAGCGGGNYCPAAPVTREQMGVFISATFGLTLYGP